ncbi:lipoprotein-releasing system permease protein [Desulfovibrionales bacterium]
MRFEFFIALRYLYTRRRQTFISLISLISLMGVALGVAALIVVIGVMNGFSIELRSKMLGVNAHAMIMNVNGGLTDPGETMKVALAVPGVTAATPFIYSEVMLSTSSGVKGVVLRGIDPATADGVLAVSRDMVVGEGLKALDRPDSLPGIVIGRELAGRLHLVLGDRVNLLSPSGRGSASGFQPKVKVLELAGIFKTGMYEYDSSLAYVSLETACELLGFHDLKATGIELKLDDLDQAHEVASRLRQSLGLSYYVRDWVEMNANLFAALKLEKMAMFVILAMIVLVGSFSIITTLVMLVMEKTRDIAILMSMGATRQVIRNVFIAQGMVVGVIGTVFGYALGLGASLLLQRYQFIKLPEDVYSMDHLPMRLQWLDCLFIGVAALVLCFLATLYPARQASSLDPVEALRFE